MIHGQCLCGGVRYELRGAPLAMYHCHCRTCRAASGASFATNVAVRLRDFAIVEGTRLLRGHESSPGKFRYFCSACGSPIYSRGQATPDLVSIRGGTLLDDPGIRPQFHAFVESTAPWVTRCDDLPAYPRARP